MLHDLLRRHLHEVESSIRRLKPAYVERYQEEILTPWRVNLRIRIRFMDGKVLELNEAVVVEAGMLVHLAYRYHFQNGDRRFIFRYDNTPHFPQLENFPHHQHLKAK